MLRQHPVNRLANSLTAVAWLAIVVLILILWLAAAKPSSASLQVDPTPDPCAPATVGPLGNLVNVRAGPGSNYELMGQLSVGETRPALARHWQFRWWQIEMADGSEAWVWDGAVALRGNIAAVPVISLPSEGEEERVAVWGPVISVTCEAPLVAETGQFLPTPTPQADDSIEDLNTNDDGWSAPINLSLSGLAVEPQMVADSERNVHVLWQEQLAEGFHYTTQLEGQWLRPAIVELPFGTRRNIPDLQADSATPLFTPVLVADSVGVVHAFWIDQVGALQYSRVTAENFGSFASWSQPRMLATTALGVVAAIDDGDGIHVGYIRSAETTEGPAGVYFQKSEDGGASWTEPTVLYASGYMRTVTTDNAHVQIAATGQANSARVYVAWDDPMLEKSFLVRSVNGGESWIGPALVDERRLDDHSEAPRPSNTILSARNDELLLVWQAGHEDVSCQQHYRYSADGGASWTQAGTILEDTVNCPTSSQLLPATLGTTLLLVRVDNQTFLLAWDDEQWSESQLQDMLTAFTNPLTLRPANLDCLQGAMTTAQELFLVGCDVGGNDIWSTTRSLEGIDGWFEDSAEWESSAMTSGMTTCPSDLHLVPGRDSSFHAFWLQESPDEARAIEYSGWDGRRWISSETLFSPQAAEIVQVSVAATPDNRILLFWLEKDGNVYYSQTSAGSNDLVISAGSWAVPQQLDLPHERVAMPDVAVDGAGNLFVAYAVPVNEDRGIYLTTSTDQGRSWNEPISVFDGAVARWQIVGRPHLTISDRGTVHVLWSEEQLLSDGSVLALALYSTQVGNDDVTFDSPEMLQTEAPTWYEVASDRAGFLHQFWQQEGRDGELLWHRQSEDDGRTWSVATILTSAPGLSAVAVNGSRGTDLHLLRIAFEEELLHWTWTDEDIERGEGVSLSIMQPDCGAAAAVSDTGQLMLAFGARETALAGEAETHSMLAVGRAVDPVVSDETAPVAVDILTNQTSATPVSPTTAATAILTPLETPAEPPAAGDWQETAPDFDSDPQQTTELSWILLGSLLPVGFVVVIILFVRRANSTRVLDD